MARPSKLTPESQSAIVEAVLHGCTYAVAAEAAGVDYNTFNEWMKKGAAEKPQPKYREFREAITRANAECAKNFTRVIQTAAAKGDWKAAESWLKRRYPREWGDAVDVTTDGKAIETKVDDARFDRAISSLSDALREVLSGADAKQNGEMDSPK